MHRFGQQLKVLLPKFIESAYFYPMEMEKNKILITCAQRISPILAEEVKALGYKVTAVERMSVETEGTLQDTMRLNMQLRTGNRVLFLIKEFTANHPDKLYNAVKSIAWEKWIDPSGYISVSSFAQNDYITDTRFPNLKTKDAIVDRIYERKGKRPDSGPDRSGTVVFLHWKLDVCQIYFDTSGETISKHGYRKIPLKAPMIESLAAATILTSNWKTDQYFINPMCGSGTLAIEAALMATNTPPGLFKDNFGFMHLLSYKEKAWQEVKKEAEDQRKTIPEGKIIATDISKEAIGAARKNAQIAGVEHLITFQVCDFRDTPIPEGSGVVFLNPEYGERLGEEKSLEEVYQQIGDFFKQKCKGYTGYIFTGNLNLAKKIGLKAKRRVEFFNSKIDSRLLEYELYQGSRKEQ